MTLLFWNYGNVKMSVFKIHVGANDDAWLECGEKEKAKCLHDHCEFKKGSCMEMIDPEGIIMILVGEVQSIIHTKQRAIGKCLWAELFRLCCMCQDFQKGCTLQ